MGFGKSLENVEVPSNKQPESFTDKLEDKTEVEKPDSIQEKEYTDNYMENLENGSYHPEDKDHNWDYSTAPNPDDYFEFEEGYPDDDELRNMLNDYNVLDNPQDYFEPKELEENPKLEAFLQDYDKWKNEQLEKHVYNEREY